MTNLVSRTCTKIPRPDEREGSLPESRPLSVYTSEPAYVLLGDPGLGKTTAFQQECGELGEAARLINARDFLALDPDSHLEWAGKTLFIDGLDEVRAGLSDARTPLDAIRGRLDALGRPPFRISCREADWLGDNDRQRLDQVAPGGKVATLRLNPLTDSDIKQVLGTTPAIGDPSIFIEEARRRGVDSLLANPQTLNMLADVVGDQEKWPQSRLETFEMACRQLATEHNEEHSLGAQPPPPKRLLDAAGYLCAAQLLTGAAGYSLRQAEVDSQYIALDDCDYGDPDILRQALATNLFTAVQEGEARRFSPIHRHVAEFLGARHLARHVDAGLSARRVLALISGPDGIVVTEMRGLSGWLAAQCLAARDLLIERDPVGVTLYGDLSPFSADAKSRLLKVMGRRETLTPILRETWFETGLTFEALASREMEPVIRDLLCESSRDPEHELLIQFVLDLLGRQHLPLTRLAPLLLDMVSDETWPPYVRSNALNGFLHVTAGGEGYVTELTDLLTGIRDGTTPDPDHEMRGALLARLYPREIPPSRIWGYRTEQGSPVIGGHYWRFWERRLLSQSSEQDIAKLLDHLFEHRGEVLPALELQRADPLPMRLLEQGLDAHGDAVTIPRLYRWLSAAAPQLGQFPQPDPKDAALRGVRRWLEKRPYIQKAVLLEGLMRIPEGERFVVEAEEVWGALHGSALTPDFGLWCLHKAVELTPSHPAAAEHLLREAFRAWKAQRNAQDLSLPVLTERVRGLPALEARLAALVEGAARSEAEAERGMSEGKRFREEQEGKRKEDIAYIRSNAEALRENRAPIGLLEGLGKAYFFYEVAGERSTFPINRHPDPIDRLSEFVGGDQHLVEAALAGLRGTPWRNDVPEGDEIIRLREESMRHRLDYAFLAGLDLLQEDGSSRLANLRQGQVRTGLAFYYCSPTVFRELPAWYAAWIDRFVGTVMDMAARCALSAIRQGDGYSPGLDAIRFLEGHPDLRYESVLDLLEKFPARAGMNKLKALDSLLWIALAHRDRSSLLDLIDRKLSLQSVGVAQRVRWLAAGVVAAPATYGTKLDEFVRNRQWRVRELAAFFESRDVSPGTPPPLPFPAHERCATALGTLISLMGCSFAPHEQTGFRPLRVGTASHTLQGLIWQLASLSEDDALQELDALASAATLIHWRDHLERARDDQRVIHRDNAYRHPDLEQLHRALKDHEPANVADLAALVHDRLLAIASTLRTGNTDDWRQYWNEDSHGRPETPKHEDSCRDALLYRLRLELPDGVDAQPEGQYAGDKRSDIRIAHEVGNVPVEIKKNGHRNLWSALKGQLAQYTRDIATAGYGVYLVLWFGEKGTPAPPTGTCPKTPAELQERLEALLAADEALKIEVLVVDVSPVT